MSEASLALGRAIQELRISAGLSARGASLESGFSESYWGKVEKGAVSPSLACFARMVETMNLKASQIGALMGFAAALRWDGMPHEAPTPVCSSGSKEVCILHYDVPPVY